MIRKCLCYGTVKTSSHTGKVSFQVKVYSPSGLFLVDGISGELLLVDLSEVDVLLDASRGDKPVDAHVSMLAKAVSAVLGLEVVRRVPAWVEDHYHVGAGDV